MITTLKITSIGNSVGVILPKELLAHFNLEKGDELHVSLTPDGYALTPYDEEFVSQMRMGEQIMREDRDVLKLLAQ
jgi:putative addiction module antidote